MGTPPHGPTFDDLYAEHWRYVFQVLPHYGIPASDPAQDDVAQIVWMTVHARLHTYQPGKHKTPRAWITGIVRRCAANHRRSERRRPAAAALDTVARVPAPGLDPEQAAILRTVHEAVRDEARREALVLQAWLGLSVAEIAAVQEVSEAAVEWRLHMARKELTAGGDEKKSRAFPGFGSVEALLSAVRPEPVPFERGARLWERLQEELRRQGGSVDDGSPSSPVPPAAVVPALAPFVGPAAVLTLTKAKLAALMAGTFLGGAAAGAGALLAWQADDAARDRHTHVTHAPESAAGAAQPPPLETAAAPETPSSTAAAAQASSPPRPPRSALHGSVAAAGDSSAWVLAQMRRAAGARDFEGALALAQQHEDRFPHAHVDEREALRIDALMQLGRSAEAERRARAVAAAQPAHRRAMERAIGHALP